MRTRQNYGGLDRFRIAAALLVIAIHTSPLASVNEGADFFLTRVLARVAVPFFFMVTGQFVVGGFLSPSAKGTARFRRYLMKTGLLYVFCILLYLPIGIYAGHYEEMNVGSALRMLVFDGTFYHLWYFPACLLGVGLVYLMSRALSLRGMTIVSALLYVIGLFGDSYYGLAQKAPALEAAYEFGFGIFSYTRNGLFLAPLFLVLGAWMSTADKRTKAAPADRQKLLFLCLSAGVSFALMTGEAFLLRHFQLQRHDSMYLALVPTMFFLYRCLICLPRKSSGYLRTASTWIYVLHPAFIVVVRGIAKPLRLTELLVENNVLHYLAVSLLSVVAGFLMAYAQMRWLSPILTARKPKSRNAALAAATGKRKRIVPAETREDNYGTDGYGGYPEGEEGYKEADGYDGSSAYPDAGIYDELPMDIDSGEYGRGATDMGPDRFGDSVMDMGPDRFGDAATGMEPDGFGDSVMDMEPDGFGDSAVGIRPDGYGNESMESDPYGAAMAHMDSDEPGNAAAGMGPDGYPGQGDGTGADESRNLRERAGSPAAGAVHTGTRAPDADASGYGGDRTASLRAWIEVDSAALARNVAFLRSRIPEHCRLMPAVKAQAYGHGAVMVSRELNRLGVDAFCVATISEGIELRRGDIKGTILILGYTPPEDFPLLSRYRLTQTVVDLPYARLLNQSGTEVSVHIGIDTGMHRLGLRCEDIDGIREAYDMPNLKVDGLFTHLCASDSPRPEHKAFTDSQVRAFYQVIDILKGEGYPCPGLHLLASYGCLNLLPDKKPAPGTPQRFADRRSVHNALRLAADYIRPGIALYGLLSTEADTRAWQEALEPVLSLKAKVASVRPLYAGEAAGYGIAFTAPGDMRIAAISIGYADGLPRALSQGKGSVLIDGCKAPVVGRICMDQTLVDVSHIPGVRQGDTAVIIGRSKDLELTAGQIAEQCGTISNEILSCLGERLDRILL